MPGRLDTVFIIFLHHSCWSYDKRILVKLEVLSVGWTKDIKRNEKMKLNLLPSGHGPQPWPRLGGTLPAQLKVEHWPGHECICFGRSGINFTPNTHLVPFRHHEFWGKVGGLSFSLSLSLQFWCWFFAFKIFSELIKSYFSRFYMQ